MLNAQNERRDLHCAPPLTWSAQLAREAQGWANECHKDHSPGALNGSYGESLAEFFPAGQSDRFASENTWYCEIKQYHFDNSNIVPGPQEQLR
jgi:uncharacterized protein YkwD